MNAYPIVCYKGILVFSKIQVLPCGTCLKLNLANFLLFHHRTLTLTIVVNLVRPSKVSHYAPNFV